MLSETKNTQRMSLEGHFNDGTYFPKLEKSKMNFKATPLVLT